LIVRRRATETSRSLGDWVSTTAGTLLPLLVRPTLDVSDFTAGQLVQIIGTALGVAGVLSLNRSVGLLPANRGVRSTGAYAIVRHPLYASYLVSQLGYVSNNFSAWNSFVVAIAFAAQVARIRGEERLLVSDPGYVAYMERTRWRLVPLVY
jgi:protein-S-isoprenylcysteine O-methyltransferase Ste14